MGKKITTKVTAGRNGGIHDIRRYVAACKWLDTHTFINAQLWHLVFYGSTNRKDYEAGLDRLCERLRDKGMRVEWRAAFEYDLEKLDPERRFHRHVFLLIEANDKKPIGVINYKTDKTGLFALLARHNLKFYICEPQDELGIHGGQPYMYVPKKAGVKLEDAKEWLSYAYKARSKAGVVGSIYSSSRKKATKQPQQAEAPAVAEEHTTTNQPDNQREGAAMNTDNQLTPAAHAYLAGVYESLVDRQLDVGQIAKELVRKGIRRTEGQVVYDLRERYGFASYAEQHPARHQPSWDELDAIEEAKASRPARRLVRASAVPALLSGSCHQ